MHSGLNAGHYSHDSDHDHKYQIQQPADDRKHRDNDHLLKDGHHKITFCQAENLLQSMGFCEKS